MPAEKQQGMLQDHDQQRAASKSSYKNLNLNNLEESTNPYYADWALKFVTEPGEATDDRLDARVNMTDPNTTAAVVETDPWTQELEEQAEKENNI